MHMNNPEYNEMLDVACELEGLLLLALSRDEVKQPLPRLIAEKAEKIMSLSQSLQTLQSQPLEEHEHEDFLGNYNFESSEDKPSPKIRNRKAAVPAEATPHQKNAKPLFTVNERYLYARELFGGKTERFNNALNEVASMDSIEEAEEFFYSELGLDPDSETTVAFMDKITAYFN